MLITKRLQFSIRIQKVLKIGGVNSINYINLVIVEVIFLLVHMFAIKYTIQPSRLFNQLKTNMKYLIEFRNRIRKTLSEN